MDAAPRPVVAEEPPTVPLTGVTEGAAPPLAFIHGFMASGALWTGVADAPQVSRRAAVALPLPGHFPWLPDPSARRRLLRDGALIDAYARALERRFPGRPALLVGHSTGVLIALEIASRRPDLVAGVFAAAGLSDGALRGRCSTLARLSATPVLGGLLSRLLFWRWLACPRQFVSGLATTLSHAEASGVVEDGPPLAMLEDLKRSDPVTMRRFGLWLLRRSMKGRLKSIAAPVCVLVCADDPVVPRDQQLALARTLPRAHAVISGCGHLPMLSRRREFATALSGWLEDQRPVDASPPAEPRADRRPAAADRPAAAGEALAL